MSKRFAPSERARVKRYNQNAAYDPETIKSILDAMPLCHVGYVFEGAPFVTPTLQWRDGDRVFWHGSSASRMLRSAEAAEVCLTVSLYDGLVMARSAYNYSINHRSVMIFGTPEKLSEEEKPIQLRNMVNKTIPGQWERLRPVSEKELKATTVLTMKITETSAKIRTGQPGDDEEDYNFPVWAGVIPVRLQVLPPEPAPPKSARRRDAGRDQRLPHRVKVNMAMGITNNLSNSADSTPWLSVCRFHCASTGRFFEEGSRRRKTPEN